MSDYKLICKKNIDPYMDVASGKVAGPFYETNFEDSKQNDLTIGEIYLSYHTGSYDEVCVYNNFFYYYFGVEYIDEYFYSEKEYRKLKLEKLNLI